MVGDLPSNHEWGSWMQPGRREEEPCSDQDLMAQAQALVLVQAQVVCPGRYVVSDSISKCT